MQDLRLAIALGRRLKWYFGRKKGAETEAPAPSAVVPMMKSQRVMLKELLQS